MTKPSTMWKRDVMEMIDDLGWKRIENSPTHMRFEILSTRVMDEFCTRLEANAFIVERNPITVTVRPHL